MKLAKTKHEFNNAIIGMLYGKSTLYKSQNTCEFYIRHSGKQFDYVDEKVRYLSNYIKPLNVKIGVDKNGYTYKCAYYKSNIFNNIYKKIYLENENKTNKYLHKNLLNRIDYIMLAFIYMDKGCLSVRKKNDKYTKSIKLILNTQNFTYKENLQLIKIIERKFHITFKIAKDKNNYRIWCNTENAYKFLDLVFPIVKEFNSMKYKLDIKQENNPYLKQ